MDGGLIIGGIINKGLLIFTIQAFVKDQLHATSMMTLQNKLLLDNILDEEHGVSLRIGPEFCTVVPTGWGFDY